MLLVLAFTLLDVWSARLWPDASAVKPWNPQIGLAVAAICAGGMRYALPVFIAAWICEVVLHASVQSTGAHAAAALAVTLGAVGTGMPAYDAELWVDRPYIMRVMDTRTRWPLFLAVVEDPAAPAE